MMVRSPDTTTRAGFWLVLETTNRPSQGTGCRMWIQTNDKTQSERVGLATRNILRFARGVYCVH